MCRSSSHVNGVWVSSLGGAIGGEAPLSLPSAHGHQVSSHIMSSSSSSSIIIHTQASSVLCSWHQVVMLQLFDCLCSARLHWPQAAAHLDVRRPAALRLPAAPLHQLLRLYAAYSPAKCCLLYPQIYAYTHKLTNATIGNFIFIFHLLVCSIPSKKDWEWKV